MFASSIGILIGSASYLALTYFPNVVGENTWILLLPSIPMSLLGNWQVFYLCIMSYIGDLNTIMEASERTETIRFMLNQVVCYVAYPAGVFFGGQLLNKWGFFSVFLASTSASLFSSILILMKIDNSILSTILMNNNGETLGNVDLRYHTNTILDDTLTTYNRHKEEHLYKGCPN